LPKISYNVWEEDVGFYCNEIGLAGDRGECFVRNKLISIVSDKIAQHLLFLNIFYLKFHTHPYLRPGNTG